MTELTLIAIALFSGILIALISAPLGCFLLWRNMSSFSDALAHSSLLGITISLFFNISPQIGAVISSIFFAVFFLLFSKSENKTTVLGVISNSFFALAILFSSIFHKRSLNLEAFLFGDILNIEFSDIKWMILLCIVTYIWLYFRYNSMLSIVINQDIAKISSVNVLRMNLEFIIMISLVISLAFKLLGILLVSSMLVIPQASAKLFAKSPKSMIIYSAIISVICVIIGVFCSYKYDSPTGPTIIISAMLFYIAGQIKEYYVQTRR